MGEAFLSSTPRGREVGIDRNDIVPAFIRASKVGTANSGVPMNMSFCFIKQ